MQLWLGVGGERGVKRTQEVRFGCIVRILKGQERLEDGYGQESSSRRPHLHILSVKSQENRLSTKCRQQAEFI